MHHRPVTRSPSAQILGDSHLHGAHLPSHSLTCTACRRQEQLPPSADFYRAITSPEGVPVLTGVFGIAQNFFSVIGQIALVLILSLYWSADQFRFERLGLSLLPEEHHSRALHIWRSKLA
ncbi:MAG: hypothetical protein ACXW4E_00780 [Anaerolineales bacterium]